MMSTYGCGSFILVERSLFGRPPLLWGENSISDLGCYRSGIYLIFLKFLSPTEKIMDLDTRSPQASCDIFPFWGLRPFLCQI